MFLGRAIAMASFSGDYSQTMRLGASENGVYTKKSRGWEYDGR